ncbi:DUF262 domain-containing protein [Dactylosporangium sp. NPDC048998]|uniref:DUF262 domain-containing protein n=1 Tax=Dactylosporangium sp. NPDC048998 TaxID=3363976 RepID=UPI00371DE874
MTHASEQPFRPQAVTYSIPQIVDFALKGILRVPRFQRSFVWDEEDVRDLFDSVWRGFPIGTLLLWRSDADAETVSFGPLAIAAPERTDALWVVDGQQRITSMVGVLNSRYRDVDRRFDLYFDLRKGRFANASGRSIPPTWIPLHEAVETRSLLSWLRDHSADLEPEDFDAADELGGVLRDYQVPAYIVVGNDDRLLRNIFDRVNSAGKPIGRADVFHALFASDTEPGSPQTVVQSLSRLGFGRVDPDRVVQSLLALRGGNIQRDLHDEFSEGEDPAVWYDRTEQAMALAIGFLRKQGIPHLRLVPSTLPLPVLAAYFHLHPDPSPWAQRLLARWLWRGWVHGFGRRGQTPALRQAIYYINPKKMQPELAPSEDQAALSLLKAVSNEESFSLRLDPFRTESSPARLALIALASLGPMDRDGNHVDLAAQFEEYGEKAISELVTNRRGQLGARGLWPYRTARPTGRENSDVLRSHAISGQAAAYLSEGKLDEFVQERAKDIDTLTYRFVTARLESKSPARPSIASLVVEDEEV